MTTLVALAASELGSSLGNTTLFILYGFYTLSRGVPEQWPPARAAAAGRLLLSLGASLTWYVASYAVAFFTPMNRIVIVGAAVTSVAAGCLWPPRRLRVLGDQPKRTPTPRAVSQKAATARWEPTSRRPISPERWG